jgi:hypothetical protein
MGDAWAISILKAAGPAIIEAALGIAAKRHLQDFTPDRVAAALERANEEFVVLFQRELERCLDLQTLMLPSYQDALRFFCREGSVQTTLAGPFETGAALDLARLDSLWREIRTLGGEPLIELPPQFSWRAIGQLFDVVVTRIMESADWIAVLNARHVVRLADTLETLKDVRPEFDLAAYRDLLTHRYAVLNLGSLDPDWQQYRLMLNQIYIAQSVKDFLPSVEMTRDYRQLKERRRLYGGLVYDDLTRQEEEYRFTPTMRLLDVVDSSHYHHLVIAGDPGSDH